jgi:hypothetical protein
MKKFYVYVLDERFEIEADGMHQGYDGEYLELYNRVGVDDEETTFLFSNYDYAHEANVKYEVTKIDREL